MAFASYLFLFSNTLFDIWLRYYDLSIDLLLPNEHLGLQRRLYYDNNNKACKQRIIFLANFLLIMALMGIFREFTSNG